MWAKATQMIRGRLNCPIGKAQAELRAAWESGEVRFKSANPVLLDNDDGITDWTRRPVPIRAEDKLTSKSDLEYWLNRNAPISLTEAQPNNKGGNSYKQDAALRAAREIFGDEIPDQTQVPNKTLCSKVRGKLPPDMAATPDKGGISNDTILRAVGRK